MSIPQKIIVNKIILIREKKVMLDSELARLYGVETKQLTRQVRRNITRFPDDFMFRLTKEEYKSLRCQIGTLKRGRHSKYLPYAFTEHGILMLSSVLQSERAIQVNIVIMRVFVRFREIASVHKELAQRIRDLERKMLNKDREIKVIFEAIRRFMVEQERSRRKIGFHAQESLKKC